MRTILRPIGSRVQQNVDYPTDLSVFLLRATASGLSGARCGGRAYSLERWQAAGHPHHDVLSVPLGAAAVVARDGAGFSNQLGMRLSLGGVVCSMGPGASE